MRAVAGCTVRQGHAAAIAPVGYVAGVAVAACWRVKEWWAAAALGQPGQGSALSGRASSSQAVL